MNRTSVVNDKKLLECLTAHPTFGNRVEALISIVEDSDKTIGKANVAEKRMIEELRKTGHSALAFSNSLTFFDAENYILLRAAEVSC